MTPVRLRFHWSQLQPSNVHNQLHIVFGVHVQAPVPGMGTFLDGCLQEGWQGYHLDIGIGSHIEQEVRGTCFQQMVC